MRLSQGCEVSVGQAAESGRREGRCRRVTRVDLVGEPWVWVAVVEVELDVVDDTAKLEVETGDVEDDGGGGVAADLEHAEEDAAGSEVDVGDCDDVGKDLSAGEAEGDSPDWEVVQLGQAIGEVVDHPSDCFHVEGGTGDVLMDVERCHFLEGTADVLTAAEEAVALVVAVAEGRRTSLVLAEMGLAFFRPGRWAASEAVAVDRAVTVDELATENGVLRLRQAAVAEAVVWADGEVAVDRAAFVLVALR